MNEYDDIVRIMKELWGEESTHAEEPIEITDKDVVRAIKELDTYARDEDGYRVVFHPICIGCGVRHMNDKGKLNEHDADCWFAEYWGLPRKFDVFNRVADKWVERMLNTKNRVWEFFHPEEE